MKRLLAGLFKRSEANAGLVTFAGQSNILGHIKATDGPKPANPNIYAWNNSDEEGAWVPARLGTAPFNDEGGGEANNAALHFADRLQRNIGKSVYIVGLGVNASTLLSWSRPGAPNMSRLLLNLDKAFKTKELRKARLRHVDSFLWLQGESDDSEATMVKEPKVATLAHYRAEFMTMLQMLQAQTWWHDGATRLIAGELVTSGWLSARNDFYGDRAQWAENPAMGVASSSGLGHIGDRAHYNGAALAEMGERMFNVRNALKTGQAVD